MRGIFFVAVFAGCLLAAAAAPCSAFGLSGAGFHSGFSDPENLDGTLTVGGHLEFEELGTHLHLRPSLWYWNSGNVSDVNPNFDMYYHFAPAGTVSPYLGAGFGLHFVTVDLARNVAADETNTGFNMMGGVLFPGQSARFFLEGRVALTKLDTTSIVGGMTFRVGH